MIGAVVKRAQTGDREGAGGCRGLRLGLHGGGGGTLRVLGSALDDNRGRFAGVFLDDAQLDIPARAMGKTWRYSSEMSEGGREGGVIKRTFREDRE
jgi:hypothetical protein